MSLLPADEAVAGSRLLALDGTSKAALWTKPMEAACDNAEASEPEIISCGAGNMLLHGRSLALLRPILGPHCEFLPVTWQGKIGYLVNVLGCAACLDQNRSRWAIGQVSGKKLRVEKYVFLRGSVPSQPVFKIEESCFDLFCASICGAKQDLKSLVTLHSITGLEFDEVWSDEESQPEAVRF